MIPIYQPSDVSRWRRRIARYGAKCTRGLLFDDTGGDFLGLSIYEDYDSGTYIAPLASPTGGGSGSGPCCCCECISPGGVGGFGGIVCTFGTTPPVYAINASGITQPNCCTPPGAQGIGPDPNGSWNAKIGGTCCAWSTDNLTGGSFTQYSDLGCTTVFETTNFIDCHWFVGYSYVASTNKYYRQVFFSVQQNDSFAGTWIVFANTTEITPEIDCSATVTLANQAICGDFFCDPLCVAGSGGGTYCIGTGGSVVLSVP